jgi:hypothetical protein
MRPMHGEIPLLRTGLLIGVLLVAAAGAAWLVQGAGEDGGDRRSGEEEGRRAAGDAAPRRAAGEARPGAPGCRVEAAGVALPDDVHEASGVAVSRAAPGVLWTHNDSGEPRVLAVGTDGAARGRVRVAGAAVEDWEDVAVGPCPGGHCLYLADIGDNRAERARITVYRLPEPDPAAATSAPAEALHAVYPDRAQDAEALFVTADGGVFVVTKGETGPVAVYRFPQPLRPGTEVTLEKVATLAGDQQRRKERITGASASPDGRWVVLRSLESLSFHRAADLAAGRTGEAVRFDVREAKEAQGEGVALADDGTVWLASEGGKKKDPATLARVACTLPS